MTVTLRQRKKGKKISLYLDYYSKGKRYCEFLRLYLSVEPEKGRLTKLQKEANRMNLELAENIRAKRHMEIHNGIYGFQDKGKLESSFIKYLDRLASLRGESYSNYANWKSAIKHVKNYSKGDVLFYEVSKDWLEGWKQYLLKDARTKNNKKLSANSQFSYYAKVSAALKQAVKDGIMKVNPAIGVNSVKQLETQREFLTLEELRSAIVANCENELLKSAFVFSALTGLRWSDIVKLQWNQVQSSKENGFYLRFAQLKTKSLQTHPISADAFSLLGERQADDDFVFKNLKYSAWNNLKLREWMQRAKIYKHITFHSARHSYATLQLTLGTDIYTVSKLLGHKTLKNTQIYAKIIDEKKTEAANRMNLGLS